MPEIKYPEDLSNFELYGDEEIDVDFTFFSELPEVCWQSTKFFITISDFFFQDQYLLTPKEQKNFENFNFTRKSFAKSIVGEIEVKNIQVNQSSRSRSCSVQSSPKMRKKRKKKRGLVRSRSDLDSFGENMEYFDSEWPALDAIPNNQMVKQKFVADIGEVKAHDFSFEPDKTKVFNSKPSKRKPKRKLSASNLEL